MIYISRPFKSIYESAIIINIDYCKIQFNISKKLNIYIVKYNYYGLKIKI